MNATLESFIDPANLPNKYGGELDFEFGQMPVLDPATDKGDYIEATAVGAMDDQERREKFCTARKRVTGSLRNEKVDDDTLKAVATTSSEISAKPVEPNGVKSSECPIVPHGAGLI
ncbi:hypothetical protein V1519DRAFT_427423, partial [Lipomyces tetrasporus]